VLFIEGVRLPCSWTTVKSALSGVTLFLDDNGVTA
jgi:hypothetical protein